VTAQLVQQQYWQPPPQPALFGEISADGTRIILIAQAGPWDQKVIGQRLSHVTALLGKVPGMPNVVTLPLTWATVTQVAWSFNGAYGSARWVPLPRLREWILAEFTRRSAPPEPLKAEFPPGLVLRDYQEEAASMIAAARKFLLLDDPGLGKSVETIAGLAEIQARGGDIFPMVILVPSWDVATVWQREIAIWMPGWRTVRWGGVSGGVRDMREALNRAGILITTYATNRIDASDVRGPLAALRPVTVVGDEVHLCKATALYTAKGNSTVSAAYRRTCAHAENIVELSGTLITQDTGDVYVPVAAPWPLDFPDRKRFTDRYLETSRAEYGEPKVEGLAPLAEPEFRAVLMGHMRRVAKADVLTQLPAKIYSVRYVDIPPEWRAAYDGMEADMLAELPDSDDELPAFDTLTRFGRLSQLACSAADVEVTEEPDAFGFPKKHYQVTLRAPSWKADVLLEILAERRGHPVAVFAPSRQLIEIAGEYCEKAGYKVGYVTGTTAGRARTAAIDGFQAGQLDVIALTTGAGGTGITLTAAGTAVFLQRPWLGESIQSEDRIHRIGSEIHEHGVEIIDIISRNSIDDRRRELLREHAGQLADFVRDSRLIRGLLGGL
jgi:SNF2 domain-containing protein/helicase-like protein